MGARPFCSFYAQSRRTKGLEHLKGMVPIDSTALPRAACLPRHCQPIPRPSTHRRVRCPHAKHVWAFTVGCDLVQRKGFEPLRCVKARVMPPQIAPRQRYVDLA
jgi:hypothetical protein